MKSGRRRQQPELSTVIPTPPLHSRRQLRPPGIEHSLEHPFMTEAQTDETVRREPPAEFVPRRLSIEQRPPEEHSQRRVIRKPLVTTARRRHSTFSTSSSSTSTATSTSSPSISSSSSFSSSFSASSSSPTAAHTANIRPPAASMGPPLSRAKAATPPQMQRISGNTNAELIRRFSHSSSEESSRSFRRSLSRRDSHSRDGSRSRSLSREHANQVGNQFVTSQHTPLLSKAASVHHLPALGTSQSQDEPPSTPSRAQRHAVPDERGGLIASYCAAALVSMRVLQAAHNDNTGNLSMQFKDLQQTTIFDVFGAINSIVGALKDSSPASANEEAEQLRRENTCLRASLEEATEGRLRDMQGFSRALQERDHALHSEEKVVVVGDEKREEKIREVDAGADALGVDDEEDAGTESPEVVDSDLITITINVTSSEALNSARADLDAATTATTAAMEVAKEAKEREHAAHRELGRLGGELADVVEQLASKTSESMVLADRLAVASHSLTLAEEQMGVLTQRIGERDSELQAANTDNARLRKMREASKEKDAEAKDLRGKLQEQSKLAKKHKADADKQGKVVKKLQEKAKEAKNCEVRAPDVAADGSDGTLVIHRSSVSSEIGSKEGLKYVPLTATARLQLAQRKDALHAEREAREVESKEHAATVVDLQAKNVQLSSELTSLSEQVRKVMAVLEQAQQLEVQNRYLKQELVDLRSDTVMALQLVQRVREMQGGATASQPGTFITHGPAST